MGKFNWATASFSVVAVTVSVIAWTRVESGDDDRTLRQMSVVCDDTELARVFGHGGGSINLYDQEGRLRVVLNTDQLVFYNANGEGVLALHAYAEHASLIARLPGKKSEEESPFVYLGIDQLGEGKIHVGHEDARGGVLVGRDHSGKLSVRLEPESGEPWEVVR